MICSEHSLLTWLTNLLCLICHPKHPVKLFYFSLVRVAFTTLHFVVCVWIMFESSVVHFCLCLYMILTWTLLIMPTLKWFDVEIFMQKCGSNFVALFTLCMVRHWASNWQLNKLARYIIMYSPIARPVCFEKNESNHSRTVR